MGSNPVRVTKGGNPSSSRMDFVLSAGFSGGQKAAREHLGIYPSTDGGKERDAPHAFPL